jgi:ribonuclease G
MSKELIVSVNGREKKIAIVEDDLVTEFYVERGDENQGIVGNIYKGRVMKVLPGMQSAFVDIGLERDSFLYVSDFFDEEDMDDVGGGEERKEPPPPPRISPRPERGRGPRDNVRYDPVVSGSDSETDTEEDKEIDLQAAISHIQELTEEPAIEILPDDDGGEDTIEELRPKEPVKVSPRQRRQRRLTYGDEPPAEAPPVRIAESVEADGEGEPEAAEVRGAVDGPAERRGEGEEEYTGRRRRRPRRRRPAETAGAGENTGAGETAEAIGRDEVAEDNRGRSRSVASNGPNEPNAKVGTATGEISTPVKEPVKPVERDDDDETAVRVGYLSPMIIAHHEPLERVTDDEAALAAGDMLRDAMMQERISGRIHDEERQVSLVEVEPTPEVTVGSLQAQLGGQSELERVSDDSEPEASEGVSPVPVVGAQSTAGEPVAETVPNLPEVVQEEEVTEEVVATPEVIEETVAESEEQPLADASAEVRQKPRRGEFATRRGGRGRRRPYRGRGTGDDETAEGDGEVEAEPEEPIAPLPPPTMAPRASDRFQRPVISDLLREGQEIIVQIAKEPIGQKGARITSHIALPGRYIVYMPTVEHIGVSRKIGTDEERQRLKRTLHTLRAEAGATGGFIVRTAANGCPVDELREDMHYLVRTWTEIRRRSERIKAPAIVHRDLDLVQRILRDQLSTDFTAIRVDNEFEYERIVDFVNRFAPKLVNRVKLYTKETPILEHNGVQTEIDKAVKPRVWLKSGGYIVINQTEALVAIDVNTGKFVGKSNRLEDTIVKTNLEAAKEIVRQIRLRDLGGIIVLDFIDMEERRNRQKVMQALEIELKNDRSPSKILQFNDFGLVAITRKRVKQSLERTLCTPCYYCGGGGMIKSAQTICYEILAESRRVSKSVDSHNEVILRVNPEVAKALRSSERDILTEVEAYLGGVVTIKSDPTIHQEQFDIALA